MPNVTNEENENTYPADALRCAYERGREAGIEEAALKLEKLGMGFTNNCCKASRTDFVAIIRSLLSKQDVENG